jgi:hypothetical protein
MYCHPIKIHLHYHILHYTTISMPYWLTTFTLSRFIHCFVLPRPSL